MSFVTLLGEAAACAKKVGIPAEVLVDALAKGGGHGAALERVGPFLLEGDPSRLKFAISHAFKDMSYYNTMAETQNCQRHIAAGVKDALGSLVEAGLGGEYLSSTAEQFGKLRAG